MTDEVVIQTDPARCIWAAVYDNGDEKELFCLIPYDEGRYCIGICEYFLEKCEGEK